MTCWKIYGMQREWPNGKGSTWIEDSGSRGYQWEAYCSSADCGHTRHTSLRAAKAAADKHIRRCHAK